MFSLVSETSRYRVAVRPAPSLTADDLDRPAEGAGYLFALRGRAGRIACIDLALRISTSYALDAGRITVPTHISSLNSSSRFPGLPEIQRTVAFFASCRESLGRRFFRLSRLRHFTFSANSEDAERRGSTESAQTAGCRTDGSTLPALFRASRFDKSRCVLQGADHVQIPQVSKETDAEGDSVGESIPT